MGLTSSFSKLTPTCRYDHGPLKRVAVTHPRTGEKVRFGWIASDLQMQFVGNMYTCSTCGYTEFFDDDPARTARDDLEGGPPIPLESEDKP